MPHSRRFIKRDVPQTRAYSPAVITQGGTLVFLAGQTVSVDAAGKSLASDFDGQVRAIFAALGKTLTPDPVQARIAASEGWIAVPACPLSDLVG